MAVKNSIAGLLITRTLRSHKHQLRDFFNRHSPYLKDASNRFTHQYFLTFLAKPDKKARWHSIKLRTELHDVDLVGADKVYVPAQ